MKDLRLGVIGAGVVGKATTMCFLDHVAEVRVYDLLLEKCTHTISDTLDTDLILICLPEGEVERFLSRAPTRNYVVRSTLPVGLLKKISLDQHHSNLIHWPEFLTERHSLTEVHNPTRNIIGIPKTGNHKSPNNCAAILLGLLNSRFPKVPLHLMSSDESEFLKLVDNAFGATKVSFFNEVRSYCVLTGMNWEKVLSGLLAGGRIGAQYTQVPGPDGKRGWGGRCWPKDLDTLIECMESAELVAPLLRAVRDRNKLIDRCD